MHQVPQSTPPPPPTPPPMLRCARPFILQQIVSFGLQSIAPGNGVCLRFIKFNHRTTLKLHSYEHRRYIIHVIAAM